MRSHCQRCNGAMFWNFEEWYCANCGWRAYIHEYPPILNPTRGEAISHGASNARGVE